MDKVKGFFSSPSAVLTDSAGDTNGADSAERGIIAEALDASSLSWSTRIQVRFRLNSALTCAVPQWLIKTHALYVT